MVRTYDVTRMPKWWRPEILRTYCFLVAYLDRNIALVPADLRKDLDESLRLTIILCEEFVKAAVVPRNRFRRVRSAFCVRPSALQSRSDCSI